MYILTGLEYNVLKSIYDYSESRGIDPIRNPIKIDRLQSSLDIRQVEIAINAMVVFNYVTRIGALVAFTKKGVEVFRNARSLGGDQHKV